MGKGIGCMQMEENATKCCESVAGISGMVCVLVSMFAKKQ